MESVLYRWDKLDKYFYNGRRWVESVILDAFECFTFLCYLYALLCIVVKCANNSDYR
ncbi:hypothetical protein WN55_11064 [Dufourea novaeangliae]|uniref:Uncharacterized protein n=1 Tax=Dufourea novaeangliae TaxID=178035 RepID=A0A154PD51_DUFNO|nr:hypothetical protein WN55_11064 [Dufourea novaeangliae]